MCGRQINAQAIQRVRRYASGSENSSDRVSREDVRLFVEEADRLLDRLVKATESEARLAQVRHILEIVRIERDTLRERIKELEKKTRL